LFTTVVRCADNARVKQEADQLLILNKPLIDFHSAIFLLVLEYGTYYGVTLSSSLENLGTQTAFGGLAPSPSLEPPTL